MSAIHEQPVVGRCSKCHRGASFEMDTYELELRSVCCWAPLDDPAAQVDAND